MLHCQTGDGSRTGWTPSHERAAPATDSSLSRRLRVRPVLSGNYQDMINPQLTDTEIIDEAVASLGVRFAGINEGSLVFVPIDASRKVDEATLQQIVERLRQPGLIHVLRALPRFSSIQLIR